MAARRFSPKQCSYCSCPYCTVTFCLHVNMSSLMSQVVLLWTFRPLILLYLVKVNTSLVFSILLVFWMPISFFILTFYSNRFLENLFHMIFCFRVGSLVTALPLSDFFLNSWIPEWVQIWLQNISRYYSAGRTYLSS